MARDHDQFSLLGAQLWSMRNDGILCDVFLQGSGTMAEEIPAHRLVLSARSSYFRAMFTSNMRESHQEKVQLPEISSADLYLLIKYIYTSYANIDEANVASLLVAAIFVNLPSLAERCWRFLEHHMDPQRCLLEYYLADRYQRTDLAEKTKQLILRHFANVARGTDFVQLDISTVMMLLGSDDLNVENEDAVLDAVLRWVRHDRAHRVAMLPGLLSTVRLAHVAAHHLQRSLAEFIGEGDHRDGGLFDQVQQAVQVACSGPNPPRDSYEFTRVFMGFSGSVKCIDPQSGVCSQFGTVPYGADLKIAGVAAMDDSVFILGHLKGRVVWYRFYPETGTWMFLASPRSAHFYGKVVVLGEEIYALGGGNTVVTTSPATRTVERYYPATNMWQKVGDLPRVLSLFGCVAHQDKIFTFGSAGLSEQVWRYGRTGLLYRIDSWTEMSKMPVRRADCSACVGDDGIIYVLGGLMRLKQHCMTVDAYDPVTDKWTRIADLDASGVGLVVGASYGRLYVTGEYRSFTQCKEGIQIYDESTRMWSTRYSPLSRLDNSVCAYVKIRTEVLHSAGRDDADEQKGEKMGGVQNAKDPGSSSENDEDNRKEIDVHDSEIFG